MHNKHFGNIHKFDFIVYYLWAGSFILVVMYWAIQQFISGFPLLPLLHFVTIHNFFITIILCLDCVNFLVCRGLSLIFLLMIMWTIRSLWLPLAPSWYSFTFINGLFLTINTLAHIAQVSIIKSIINPKLCLIYLYKLCKAVKEPELTLNYLCGFLISRNYLYPYFLCPNQTDDNNNNISYGMHVFHKFWLTFSKVYRKLIQIIIIIIMALGIRMNIWRREKN